MGISTYSFPTSIHFGAGARARAPQHLLERGFKAPLIVTDRDVAKLPFATEFVAALEKAGLRPTVFSGVWGNPVKSQVTAGVAAFAKASADSIIGIGGGAALDVAKAIALMIHHPGDLFDYEDDKPGARPFDQKIPYWIALPTTSGTGSEVGRSSVISDDTTHIKKIIFSPRLLAPAVFADPELTLGLPPGVTAATGMDALTHNIEAFLAKADHPICDGIALEGVRLAALHLVRATQTGTDIAARGGMMMSSMMGAIAFQKGLGVVHSCAHALGTVCDMHHGLANAVMIDHALKHNVEAVPERFSRMATTVGLADASPKGFLQWLSGLKQALKIPQTLAAAKVERSALEKLAQVAVEDGCHPSSPRAYVHADFIKIFEEAAS